MKPCSRCGSDEKLRDGRCAPCRRDRERNTRLPDHLQDAIQSELDREGKRHARADLKTTVRQEYIRETAETWANRVFKGRVQPTSRRYTPKPAGRTNVCVLSDLHFGSDLRADETGYLDFGVTQEARRMARVCAEFCEYKLDHRPTTRARVLILGDIIAGLLHDMRDGEILALQQCRAIHLLTQFVARVADAYPAGVDVECQTGNHGRNKMRHNSRATVQKYDSFETVIYYSVAAACANLTNVSFSIPKTPYSRFKQHGAWFFCTHGDTVLNVGNPGRRIDITGIEKQINRFNASLEDRDEYSVVIAGHVHVPVSTMISSGAHLLINGSLIPSDNFCVSIGLLENVCAQWIFESVDGYPVGDSRLLRLDSSVDRDTKLDEVIRPFDGLPQRKA